MAVLEQELARLHVHVGVDVQAAEDEAVDDGMEEIHVLLHHLKISFDFSKGANCTEIPHWRNRKRRSAVRERHHRRRQHQEFNGTIV